MATTYSSNIGLPEPTTGDPSSANTWGILLNTGANITDAITSGVKTVAVGGNTNVVLTFSLGTVDQTCGAHFDLTGVLTGNVVVLWPNGRDRMFSVANQTTGDFTLSLGVNNGSGLPAGTTQAIASGATAQFLSDGTNVLPRGSGGITQVNQLPPFTATGTYVPSAGMLYCIVEMVGGGAGGFQQSSGNYGGGGGGAGEYARGTFSAAAIGTNQVVTIGAGGAASSNGGTTSLGTLLTAAGGSTGISGAAYGGLGGTGGTGTGPHIHGGSGSNATFLLTTPQFSGGSGGASFFGGGGRGGVGLLDNAKPGVAYGSGGGGNGILSTDWDLAGMGAGGVMFITEFIAV